ncbi:MAG: phosphoribosyltransferase [Bacillus sp. (in: Bacteria)]|nr:phosphoribosyltransferase [Bacillus sp. (in: firmicutes)]
MPGSESIQPYVRHSLIINPSIPPGINQYNILLVDDFVDSGWTLTVAAEMIGLEYQVDKVIPFAIAITGQSDD